MWDINPTWFTYEDAQLGSCHGPAGGAPAAGVGGGVSTERIPQGKPAPLGAAGRGSHQDTETQRAQRDSVQYSCKTKLRADGQAEVHVSSGEESEAVTKEEDENEDEFVTERKEPVPKWEVLAENKAVWEQFCKQLRLEVGSLGYGWTGQQSGSGFCNLAPSILHYNWF
jgi:hypothetical protein